MKGLSTPSCDLHNFSDLPLVARFDGIDYDFEPGEVAYSVAADVASHIEDIYGEQGLVRVEVHPEASAAERKDAVDRARIRALEMMLRKAVEMHTFAVATVMDHGTHHALHPAHDHRPRFQKRIEAIEAMLAKAPQPKAQAPAKRRKLSEEPAPVTTRSRKAASLGSSTAGGSRPMASPQDMAEASEFI